MTLADHQNLSAEQFDSLFDEFTTSSVRLETLPAYNVGGAEEKRLTAHRLGQPRPLRNVRTDRWLARIATDTILSGKQWTRVRVVDDPLTDYQRWQLNSYRESQAVGEQVLIARRAEVGDVGPDFWLLDQRLVVVMHYHLDGSVDRFEYVIDPVTVAECTGRVGGVADRAVPLNRFLTDLGV